VVASYSLVIELLAQIPFLGLNILQGVFGGFAVLLAVLAFHARSAGWRRAG
jgi:hypothetical protein